MFFEIEGKEETFKLHSSEESAFENWYLCTIDKKPKLWWFIQMRRYTTVYWIPLEGP